MSEFSFSTIENFDNHISNSIAGYDILHELIINISSFFANKDSTVIDLGCTSGKLLNKINIKYHSKVIGYDIIRNNFIDGVDLRVQDITDKDFIIPDNNLTYLIFTLQFIDVDKRKLILDKVLNSLLPGGALIICEKELSQIGIMQEIFTFSNYSYKRNCFTSEEILNKEQDLRKIMRCSIEGTNENLLKDRFNIVELFFKSLNFKGYLCIK